MIAWRLEAYLYKKGPSKTYTQIIFTNWQDGIYDTGTLKLNLIQIFLRVYVVVKKRLR